MAPKSLVYASVAFVWCAAPSTRCTMLPMTTDIQLPTHYLDILERCLQS